MLASNLISEIPHTMYDVRLETIRQNELVLQINQQFHQVFSFFSCSDTTLHRSMQRRTKTVNEMNFFISLVLICLTLKQENHIFSQDTLRLRFTYH